MAFINVLEAPYLVQLDGVFDASIAVQQAIDDLVRQGGNGTVYLPGASQPYFWRYPVFVPSNIRVVGDGMTTRLRVAISGDEGRCAFVVGNSREWNRARRDMLVASKIRGTLRNDAFTDIPFQDGRRLEPDDSRIRSRYASIENLFIDFDYTSTRSNSGGYAIQFAHAANCFARNIWIRNATQGIGIGNDVDGSTPGCVETWAENIYVESPNKVSSYYSIGFIANSNRCYIRNGESYDPVAETTEHGSLASIANSNACRLEHIRGHVGRGQTSEGILINNSRACTVDTAHIENARVGIATHFYSDAARGGIINAAHPNLFRNIVVKNSDTMLQLSSKYDLFEHVRGFGNLTDIYFNLNATDNRILDSTSDRIGKSAEIATLSWVLQNNVVGPREGKLATEDTVFHPLHFLMPHSHDGIRAFNHNYMSFNGAINCRIIVPLQVLGIYSLKSFRLYYTFYAGSDAAQSSIVVTIYRRLTFDSNISAPHQVLKSATAGPTGSATQDGMIDLEVNALRASGISKDIIIDIQVNNPVMHSMLKLGRITSYINE
ncbi:pectate lyase family protein [Paenibacillus xanthanilyticus]|uniref:Uncharacterized protein n=1 Tax=Paenibacillus xanthanilyticus TaxID=1783531 RepID=A0ABV8K013_9BACL